MQIPIANFLAELRPLLVPPPPPISDEHFDQLARNLFAAQFEFVQPYRNYCLARGLTPATVNHWTAIPSVPTAAFKEFDWTCLPPGERSRVFLSSGTTTDTPSRHLHDAASLEIYERSILAWAPQWLFPPTHPRPDLLFLTPLPRNAPHSSLVHMFETLHRVWGTPESYYFGNRDPSGLWTVAAEPIRNALTHARSANRPVAIFGTAFSLVELLDQLAAYHTHFALPPGSRILETGGYKSRSRALPKSELYRLLSEALGIPGNAIVSEYGMCELSSQAYDHVACAPEPDSGRIFRFPPWTRPLVINPNTNAPAAPGENGLLRVFDLANACSVLAIQTEDLACQQKDGFVLLGRATAAEARGCSLRSG